LGEVFSSHGGVVNEILPGLLERIVWELYHECSGEFGSLAIVVSQSSDRSGLVCRAKDVPTLPSETILGMAVEEWQAQLSCRVRDHALDTVRFIDARFRSSILLKLALPKDLFETAEGLVWVGLHGTASAKRIELAQLMVAELSEWLVLYAPVLKGAIELNSNLASLRRIVGESRSLAHDVKAPVAALKYLVSDLHGSHTEITGDEHINLVRDELNYVERLLERFAPSADSSYSDSGGEFSSDLILIAKRVCDRFYAQAHKLGLRFRIVTREEQNSHRVNISELDLERVLSNLVGNGVMHSGGSEIRIDIEQTQRGSWIVRISDNGVGLPSSVIERVMLGRDFATLKALNSDVHSSHLVSGWGIGLSGCRSILQRHGGDLAILSPKVGTQVEVVLRGCAAPVKSYRATRELETTPGPEFNERLPAGADIACNSSERRLIIVDDDREHSKSLARILERRGIKTDVYDRVDAALKACLSGGVGESREVVVCDAQMPDGGAERMLKLLNTSGVRVRLAVMSGETSDASLYRFAALGAREFFAKPLDIERVIAWL
jgi:signal transduction histidine kinase